MKRVHVFTFLIFFSLALCFPSFLFAEVVVRDRVAVAGRPVTIEAETRSKFFKKGGELVEFFIDGKSIGRTLSGGDGLAYKEITPRTTGLIEISAASGEDRGKGLLLVLKKRTGVVFIDVEGSLTEGQFSLKPKEGSKEAVKKIASRFPVVYLRTGMLGSGMIRKWLAENGFEDAPLIPWDNGEVFDEINDMGLKVKAVIGSSSVTSSAGEHSPASFTFDEENEDGVESWEDIEKKLQ